MNFMNCNTCKRVVQVNCTGICLSCQRGFMHEDSEDAFITAEQQKKKLEERLEEIEDALEGKNEKMQALPKRSKKKRSQRKE